MPTSDQELREQSLRDQINSYVSHHQPNKRAAQLPRFGTSTRKAHRLAKLQATSTDLSIDMTQPDVHKSDVSFLAQLKPNQLDALLQKIKVTSSPQQHESKSSFKVPGPRAANAKGVSLASASSKAKPSSQVMETLKETVSANSDIPLMDSPKTTNSHLALIDDLPIKISSSPGPGLNSVLDNIKLSVKDMQLPTDAPLHIASSHMSSPKRGFSFGLRTEERA